jgi:cytochrome c551/c552
LKDSIPKFGEKSNYVPGTRRGLQGNTKQFPMPSTTTLSENAYCTVLLIRAIHFQR